MSANRIMRPYSNQDEFNDAFNLLQQSMQLLTKMKPHIQNAFQCKNGLRSTIRVLHDQISILEQNNKNLQDDNTKLKSKIQTLENDILSLSLSNKQDQNYLTQNKTNTYDPILDDDDFLKEIDDNEFDLANKSDNLNVSMLK